MTETRSLQELLRWGSKAIFLVTETEVATGVRDLFLQAADRIDALEGALKTSRQLYIRPHHGEGCSCEACKIRRVIDAALHPQTGAEMSEWKPIETLKMADGFQCDIWHTSLGRITDAKVIKGEWHLWGSDGFDGNGWVRVPQTMCVTHFMPIPPPPSDHHDAQGGGMK